MFTHSFFVPYLYMHVLILAISTLVCCLLINLNPSTHSIEISYSRLHSLRIRSSSSSVSNSSVKNKYCGTALHRLTVRKDNNFQTCALHSPPIDRPQQLLICRTALFTLHRLPSAKTIIFRTALTLYRLTVRLRYMRKHQLGVILAASRISRDVDQATAA